jgi:hypothetical protein
MRMEDGGQMIEMDVEDESMMVEGGGRFEE